MTRRRSLAYQLLFFALAITFLSCRHSSDDPAKAGIAISFDDHFIKDWHALRPLFKKYGAKATFFVTCKDSLSAEDTKLLKELEADGHEIGFHGTIHGRSTELIGVSVKNYLDTEITPGLTGMRKAGFAPVSYAHPGGNHNPQVDSVLFANGFTILRDVAIAHRVYRGIPLYSLSPRVMNWIFYGFDHTRAVDALLIDTDSGLSEEDMRDAVERASDTGTALMVFGHQPLYAPPTNGAYGFDVGFLEKILAEASAKKLRFYTMSELPKL